ncbi:mechanosensitive ion channel family protein [Stratiformator vulcanicus]|uniref:Low conductance mechanosensitive channel YnaI n=1 Tax=Stratiformator vulcanicus TaxID=2527980 RepID=A0A517R1Q7_9PLAN|nr:mechanosensitive ion channel family protein [Stratiformator vulcanicus]QDT37791.1 Low conductance mechanosensitive channel YnaI [Stratiformator vulcanicus]
MGRYACFGLFLFAFLTTAPTFSSAQITPSSGSQSSDEESGPASSGDSTGDLENSGDEAEGVKKPIDGVELISGAASFVADLELERLWFETPAWGWITFFSGVGGGIAAGMVLSILFNGIASRFRQWEAKEALATFFDKLSGPVCLLAISIGTAIGLSALPLSESLQYVTGVLIALAILLALFWGLLNMVAVLEVVLTRRVKSTEGKLDDQALPLIRRSLRVFIFILAVLTIADNVFGADVGAALAGLGIAGIAVSLAAQDSLKNLFGSLTILFDDPFQIGERIVFQGHDGIIEKVGFRSTKLRTLTGHLVTIPNSAIVNESVENIGRRPTIRRLMNIGVTYDTPTEKLQEGVKIIRELLDSDDLKGPVHPTVDGDTRDPIVYFTEFNADNLGILVVYWYGPPDYVAYLEHGHRFNLALLDRFEEAGIEFAFPTETLMLAGDTKRELSVKMLGESLKQE